MLIIPLKCAPRYDLREPLSKWLDGGSNEAPANPMEQVHVRPDFKSSDCRDDLVRLASLRNCLSDSIAKPMSHKVALEDFALQDLQEYHAALLEFIKRGFPTRDEVAPSLQLTWKAAIGDETETHGSLQWDRACVVWNIAALESYQASTQPNTKEGRKQAVKHYQTAASMIRYLHDEVVSDQDYATVDLSKPSLKFWESCMLAQAQLATYQLVDKHALKSYLAMGGVPLFNEALQYSKDTLLASQLPAEEWSVYCKAWSMYLYSKAAYHQACAAQESQSWGLELAWLQETQTSLQSTLDFVHKHLQDATMEKELSQLIQMTQQRYGQAAKDNTSLYGEDVPAKLPTVPPKQLVKSDHPLSEAMTKPKKPLFQ